MKYAAFFLKRHRKSLLLLVLYGAIFGLLFELGNVPAAVAWYGFALCALFTAVVYGVACVRFVWEIRLLRRIMDDLPLGLEYLPGAEDARDYLYQEMLRRMKRLCEEQEQTARQKEQDEAEYFTLWAHQIKTPIAAIRLLLTGKDDPMWQEVLAQLFRIEQYVEMALNYQRLDGASGDWVLKRQPLDPIIRASIRKYARQFIRKKLKLDYEETKLWVLTDGKWLGFVLDQILSNALKYTRSGGIVISTRGSTLFVEDSGIGIRPEDLPRIFDRGYTGYNGHEDKRSTGIGLYLCRRICEKLGHRIFAKSTMGEGSCFGISLDIHEMEIF